MTETIERRKEKRLYCRWPIWCAEGFGKTLYHGEMLNISSEGVAFTCQIDKNFPQPGQQLTIQFSVPRLGSEDASDMTIFTRISRVRRIDAMDKTLNSIAVQFDEPLPFKPTKLAAVNQMLSQTEKP